MAQDFFQRKKYMIEFETNRKRVLSLFPKGKDIGLRFTEIRDQTGLNNRKAVAILKSLIDDELMEKKKDGKRHLYYSKLKNYTGDFDSWELMTKINEISQRRGNVIRHDVGMISGLCSVVIYGCPPFEKLTDVEGDMVWQLMLKLRADFLQLRNIVDSIEFRKSIEKKVKLPDNCKGHIFGDESCGADFATLDKIYGDNLWQYIVNHYADIFNFQLSHGNMDTHGLIDLFLVLDSMSEAIDKTSEKKGFGNANEFPQTDTSIKIPEKSPFRGFFDNKIKDNAFGAMVMPSPRTLDDYCDQIGWIIRDQIGTWEYDHLGKKEKMEDIDWNLPLDGSPSKRKRREYLKVGIIQDLLFRKRLTEAEKRFMLSEPNLNYILRKDEIKEIISRTEDIRSRLVHFYKIKEGKKLGELKKDPKWFTEEEKTDFRPVRDLDFGMEFEEETGSKMPSSFVVDFNPEGMGEKAKKAIEGQKTDFVKEYLRRKPKASNGAAGGDKS